MRRTIAGFMAAGLCLATVAQAGGTAGVVRDGKRVSIEYTVKLDDGTTADTNVGKAPLIITKGAGMLPAAVWTALLGLKVNDSRQLTLPPEQAYGPVEVDATREVDISMIPARKRHEGATLVTRDESGERRVVTIRQLDGAKAVLDMNHPLAGETLTFDLRVVKVE